MEQCIKKIGFQNFPILYQYQQIMEKPTEGHLQNLFDIESKDLLPLFSGKKDYEKKIKINDQQFQKYKITKNERMKNKNKMTNQSNMSDKINQRNMALKTTYSGHQRHQLSQDKKALKYYVIKFDLEQIYYYIIETYEIKENSKFEQIYPYNNNKNNQQEIKLDKKFLRKLRKLKIKEEKQTGRVKDDLKIYYVKVNISKDQDREEEKSEEEEISNHSNKKEKTVFVAKDGQQNPKARISSHNTSYNNKLVITQQYDEEQNKGLYSQKDYVIFNIQNQITQVGQQSQLQGQSVDDFIKNLKESNQKLQQQAKMKIKQLQKEEQSLNNKYILKNNTNIKYQIPQFMEEPQLKEKDQTPDEFINNLQNQNQKLQQLLNMKTEQLKGEKSSINQHNLGENKIKYFESQEFKQLENVSNKYQGNQYLQQRTHQINQQKNGSQQNKNYVNNQVMSYIQNQFPQFVQQSQLKNQSPDKYINNQRQANLNIHQELKMKVKQHEGENELDQFTNQLQKSNERLQQQLNVNNIRLQNQQNFNNTRTEWDKKDQNNQGLGKGQYLNLKQLIQGIQNEQETMINQQSHILQPVKSRRDKQPRLNHEIVNSGEPKDSLNVNQQEVKPKINKNQNGNPQIQESKINVKAEGQGGNPGGNNQGDICNIW